MVSVDYYFQWGTCCLHLQTICTEEYRGPIESCVTWCNHLKPEEQDENTTFYL